MREKNEQSYGFDELAKLYFISYTIESRNNRNIFGYSFIKRMLFNDITLLKLIIT